VRIPLRDSSVEPMGPQNQVDVRRIDYTNDLYSQLFSSIKNALVDSNSAQTSGVANVDVARCGINGSRGQILIPAIPASSTQGQPHDTACGTHGFQGIVGLNSSDNRATAAALPRRSGYAKEGGHQTLVEAQREVQEQDRSIRVTK
ncbi:unnamed protein product, partial [Sphacelaria rigidula]